jgi:predicted dinucleotide-binding enzyme
MKIAVIGSGNVGGTLARKWSEKGHEVRIGARNPENSKGTRLTGISSLQFCNIHDAVQNSEVILIAVPAPSAPDAVRSLGDTTGKIIIDSMNIVGGKGPAGFTNVGDAILANTNSLDVVKCFNTTGFNNMENPAYPGAALDMFMAGDSKTGKQVAHQLAIDTGFAECYDAGGNDKFFLLEQLANFWINMAMSRGLGREIGIKILKR